MDDLLTILGSALFIVAYGVFWFVVFRKAGYESGTCMLMSVGMFIPLLNLGVAFYFATATWPVQQTRNSLRIQSGHGAEMDPYAVLSTGTRLERSGDVTGAIATYMEVVRRFPGTDAAKDAQASVRALNEKIGKD